MSAWSLTGPRRTLTVYAASRLLTLATVWIVAVRRDTGVLRLLANWDAGWFLQIVHSGYPAQIPTANGAVGQSTLAFFPLYPLVTRAVAWVLPGPDAWAAIAVSLICGAIGALLVHRIAELVSNRATADRAVLLYCIFPGSMVLTWAYSEGLMVALAAGCILALLRSRWLTAGLLAAAATACRPTAIVLVGVCLWEAAAVARRGRTWRPMLAPALAPLGTLAFFGYLWVRTGDVLAFIHAEKAWAVHPGVGGTTFHIVQTAISTPRARPGFTIALVTLVFAATSIVVLVRRRWPVMLTLYSVGIVALSVASRSDGLRPRDVLTAFPLLIAVSAAVPGRRWLGWAMWAFLPLLLASLVYHGTGAWGQP